MDLDSDVDAAASIDIRGQATKYFYRKIFGVKRLSTFMEE
jgi:hypothetical protein